MRTVTNLDELLLKLRANLREDSSPFFSDEELIFLLEDAGGDLREATYNGLIRKSQDDSINLKGIVAPNNKAYWLRLAGQYRRNHGGCLNRG